MNDNANPRFGIVESIKTGRYAIVEFDKLGPIMRAGPYPFDEAEAAPERLRAYETFRHIGEALAIEESRP